MHIEADKTIQSQASEVDSSDNNDKMTEIYTQIMLSERSLNSLLWELHANNLTVLEYDMSSTLMKTFFPNFEEVFGHHDNLGVQLQSMTAPTVSIRDSLAIVKTDGKLRFLNPYDEDFDCLTIDVDLEIAIKMELLQGFTLSGSVVNLTMDVTGLKTYFKSKVRVPDLVTKVSALNQHLIEAINT